MILRNLDLLIFELLRKRKRKILYIFYFRNKFFTRINFKKGILIFSILIPFFFQKQLFSSVKSVKFDLEKDPVKWQKIKVEKQYEKHIIWQKKENTKDNLLPIKEVINYQDFSKKINHDIGSFN